MAETDFAALRFLPWVRDGAAAEMNDGGAVDVAFKVNGQDVAMLLGMEFLVNTTSQVLNRVRQQT